MLLISRFATFDPANIKSSLSMDSPVRPATPKSIPLLTSMYLGVASSPPSRARSDIEAKSVSQY